MYVYNDANRKATLFEVHKKNQLHTINKILIVYLQPDCLHFFKYAKVM